MVATDMDIAQMLMKSNKPIVLCVNKCDGIGEPTPEFYEFYNLGLGDPIQVSSVHGHGTGDLLDNVFEHLDFTEDSEDDGTVINVAVIGKPNAGKSSLINKITNEERCIVSDIAGTTRDTIDTMIEISTVNLTLPIQQDFVVRIKFMMILKSTVLSEQRWLLNAVMYALL